MPHFGESILANRDKATRNLGRLNQMVPQLTEALPDKPSELLELALADVTKIEQTKQIDGIPGDVIMSHWLRVDVPRGESVTPYCSACLAGAVIGNRLQLAMFEAPFQITPGILPPEIVRKMRFLDRIRLGSIQEALSELDIPQPPGLRTWYAVHIWNGVIDWPADFQQWKRDMEEIVALLRAYGL